MRLGNWSSCSTRRRSHPPDCRPGVDSRPRSATPTTRGEAANATATCDHAADQNGGGIAAHTAGPAARDESWSHLHADGALHCMLWVAEWPRIDVRALFMQPLLMDTQGTRTIAMCMELVGPAGAIRRPSVPRPRPRPNAPAQPRRPAHLRATSTARPRRQPPRNRARPGPHRRALRAYVSVSVQDGPGARDELEAAVSRVDLEAKRAPLRLERMWGQQAEAFTYTLPLCRGCDECRSRTARRPARRASRAACASQTLTRERSRPRASRWGVSRGLPNGSATRSRPRTSRPPTQPSSKPVSAQTACISAVTCTAGRSSMTRGSCTAPACLTTPTSL